MVDGVDIEIFKTQDNLLQSLSWSVKNNYNSMRLLFVATTTGIPVMTLPRHGMCSTGRHNDNNTFDVFWGHNVSGISELFPLAKTNFFLDRGFQRSGIVQYTSTTSLLPCIQSNIPSSNNIIDPTRLLLEGDVTELIRQQIIKWVEVWNNNNNDKESNHKPLPKSKSKGLCA